MKNKLMWLGLVCAAAYGPNAMATLAAQNNTVEAGDTGETSLITYTTRAGVGQAGFALDITDANDIVVDASVSFQVFDAGANAFVACDGNEKPQSFTVFIGCSQDGIYSLRATAGDLPTLSNNMRVVYNIAGSAAGGQTATLAFGAYCTGTETSANDRCVAYFDAVTTQRIENPAQPVAQNGTITVQGAAATAPTLTFPASVTATGAGTQVGDTAAGTVAIGATGGSGGGEASYDCGTAPTGFTFTSASAQSNIGQGDDPNDITFSCTRGTSANTQNMACTVTDGAGTGRTVNVSLTCPVGNSAPDVTTSNPAPGGTVNMSGGAVGSTASGTIVFTATPGSGTGPEATTTLSCTSVAPVSIFFGANAPSQGPAAFDLVGGATTATLQVRLPLTASAQNIAAAITCTENGAPFGTYSVAAGAGTTFVPPEIPTASTWSKIALFGFLAMFGMLAVGFGRQG